MSYKPLHREDSISELFSKINDFNMLSKKLMQSKGSLDSFGIWLYKCMEVDRRSLYFFLMGNRDKLSSMEWEACRYVLPNLQQERGDRHGYTVQGEDRLQGS